MQQSFRVLQQSGGSALEHNQNAAPQAAEDFSISANKNHHHHHHHHHKTTTATVVVDLLPPAYTSVLGHSHLQAPASTPQQGKIDSLKGEVQFLVTILPGH
jgi:ABC-type nickel/cobalt efflux system permease component RcnA